MAGARPDWRLTVVDKTSNRKGYVGAAWSNDKGGISIRLDPGVVLNWKDDLTIGLWPADDRPRAQRQQEETDLPGEHVPF